MPSALPRVLVCTVGTPGHQRPIRPLAAALVRAGCEVLWATSPDAVEDLSDLAGVRAVGLGIDMRAARAAYRQRWPEAATLDPTVLADHTFPRLFGGVVAPAMLAPLEALLSSWQPAFVIGEPASLAVPIACAAQRTPHVTHGYGLALPRSHLEGAARELAGEWAAIGEAPPADAGLYRHGYIDIAPPLFGAGADEALGDCPRWTLRPSPGTPSAQLPERLRHRLSDGRPLVYVTFGTAYNQADALRALACELAALDTLVLVTHGAHEAAPGWLDCPANVVVERFVEQSALLPRCALVVSHGGAGTVLGAAAAGVPQLLLPRGADQFRNARAVQAAGVGLALLPGRHGASDVRDAARALMASSAVAARSRHLALEIARMPDADEVAARLLAALQVSVNAVASEGPRA